MDVILYSKIQKANGDINSLDKTVNGERIINFEYGKNIKMENGSPVIFEDENSCLTELIPLTWEWESTDYYRWYYNKGTSSSSFRLIFYDENKDYINNHSIDENVFRTCPGYDGAKYIRFSFRNGTTGKIATNVSTPVSLWESVDEVMQVGLTEKVGDIGDLTTTEKTNVVGAVNEVNSYIGQLYSETEEQHTVTSEIEGLTWLDGYVYNGTWTESSSYKYTTIQVQKGDVITPNDGTIDRTIRFADLMNGETLVSALSNQLPLTITNGITAAVISVAKTYVDAEGFKVKRTRTVTETVVTGKVSVLNGHALNTEKNNIQFNFDLSADNVFNDPEYRTLSDCCGYNIVFDAKISSNLSGQVIVGKGYSNSDGCAVGLDATNLYIYENGAVIGSPSYTQAHGLTLKDYICIEVDVHYTLTDCKVRLKTNGGEYTYTPTRWRSQNGILSVRSTLDNLTGCTLSYACAALDNEIWMYGDSYLSWHNPSRWAYWLVEAGHTKYLINSYPGRQSLAAYESFLVDVSMHKLPNKIIWIMGMNDKDGDSEPNANWLTAVEKMMDFCAKKGIELILSTIPNVPSSATKNTLKNAYVVASGKRYIDFAKAVSADGSTTWYEDMLYTDNVHPTKEGAKALYAAAVATVPELLK